MKNILIHKNSFSKSMQKLPIEVKIWLGFAGLVGIQFLALIIYFQNNFIYQATFWDVVLLWILPSIVFGFIFYLLILRWINTPIKGMFAAIDQMQRDGPQQENIVITHDLIGKMFSVTADMHSSFHLSKEFLRQTRIRYESIINSIGEGLIVTDKEGNILMMNTVAQELLSLKVNTVISKPILQMLNEGESESLADMEKPENHLKQAIDTGKKVSAIHYYHRKDLSRFPAAVTITPIKYDEEIIGAVEIFRDITEEKEIDKIKTEFISIVSHQLRSPLSIIRWHARLLTSGDLGKLSDDQHAEVNLIYNIDLKLIALVNSLLNMTRIESGTLVVSFTEVDIILIINEEIHEIKTQFDVKKQTIESSFTNPVQKIETDAKLIRHVFQNLLNNASKYSANGSIINIQSIIKDDQFVVTITDQGIGIPKDQQHKVFKRFFRADNAKSFSADGNGLGLYFAKQVVEACNGTISYESEFGKGSSFTVCLPLKINDQSKLKIDI